LRTFIFTALRNLWRQLLFNKYITGWSGRQQETSLPGQAAGPTLGLGSLIPDP
jgi:hypothetical protein